MEAVHLGADSINPKRVNFGSRDINKESTAPNKSNKESTAPNINNKEQHQQEYTTGGRPRFI
jgi:hypothetical protein